MSKWALALEGGSLRCMFTAGVVDVMMERGLLFDGVFGVSAGALTGVNYVSGQIGRTAQVNLDYVNDKRYLGLGNLIFHKSIFNFDFLFGEISDSLWTGRPLPSPPALTQPLPPTAAPASLCMRKSTPVQTSMGPYGPAPACLCCPPWCWWRESPV